MFFCLKKIFVPLFFCLFFSAFTAQAQSPQQVLDKAIAALRNGGIMSANYQLKSSQGNNSGTIIMSGAKYRLMSTDIKSWFDGKTQWTWSKATDEVNITTPTAEDLQMTNPMAAAADFKKNYHMWKAKGQIAGHYAMLLRPKVKSNIDRVYLYMTNGSNLLHIAHIKMTDGTTFSITLSNYKTNQSLPASTFTFEKSMVPQGTQVVDLR